MAQVAQVECPQLDSQGAVIWKKTLVGAGDGRQRCRTKISKVLVDAVLCNDLNPTALPYLMLIVIVNSMLLRIFWKRHFACTTHDL